MSGNSLDSQFGSGVCSEWVLALSTRILNGLGAVYSLNWETTTEPSSWINGGGITAP